MRPLDGEMEMMCLLEHSLERWCKNRPEDVHRLVSNLSTSGVCGLTSISVQVEGLLDGLAYIHSKNEEKGFDNVQNWEKWGDTEFEVDVPWMHGAIKPVRLRCCNDP